MVKKFIYRTRMAIELIRLGGIVVFNESGLKPDGTPYFRAWSMNSEQHKVL